jgi:hypothetical protein
LICEEWQLPQLQAVAIKYHHNPNTVPDNELASILYLADFMARKCGLGTEPIDDSETITPKVLERLEFKQEDLDPVMHEISEYVENISKSVF